MKRPIRGFAVYAMILVAVLLIAQVFTAFSGSPVTAISYNELMDMVKNNEIGAIAIDDTQLVGLKKDTTISRESFPLRYDFECTVDRDNFFTSVRVLTAQRLDKSIEEIADSDFGFEIEYLQPEKTPWYVEFLPYIIMTGLLIVFWLFMVRQQSGGGNKMMSFGKSRARMYDMSKKRVTFADVAGADEEKEEMAEIVEFLKNPRRFTEIGARIPKGVLLVGPPGTGKTLLAKAVAGEANVPFFSISGSDFVEMFVGVGASRVRDLFEQAKKHTPSIVFIDEIDAVGRQRGAGLGGGHDEREQTLNQLLVEMDGFAINEGVIVLAATNRRDILDPALLRPGRFDRQITVNYPDVGGREAILKVHTRNKPLEEDVDLKTIARRTPFFTGADLENVMNEAAILAARAGMKKIGQRTIEEAITRVEMGPEKKSRKVGKIDQRICAYHEAGHALVGAKLEKCDDVHMVTIVPRGTSGGHTQLLPNEENEFVSKQQLIDRITMALGGRAAETLVIKDVTTGAVGDLQMATETARRMVTQFGMNENIGPVYLSTSQEVFLGRDIGQSRNCSEQVAAQVDEEIRKTMESCQKHAEEILEENMAVLHLMAETLIERETITAEDIKILLRGEKLPEKKEEVKAEEKVEEKAEEAEVKSEDAEAKAEAAEETQKTIQND